METIEKKKDEELTELTQELLIRTKMIRDSVKKSMVVGEFDILRGIIIFEVVLKELNPSKMDDNEITRITNFINVYLRNKEEREQKVNKYIHHGVSQCLVMLDGYNKAIKRKTHEKN